MNIDEHISPPTIGPGAGRRVRGRAATRPSRLTRRPRTESAAADLEQGAPEAAGLAEWHAMSEPEYVLAWEELRKWTTWLISRYRLVLEDRIPPCWPEHPELIEELWALRAWRTEAYGSESSGQSAVYWHQALVAFLGHVSAWWAGGCRAGHAEAETEIHDSQTELWASADPLTGIPAAMRPIASTLTDSATKQGEIAMPNVNVLSGKQMKALTNAGLAHPQHDTIVAFTYYDGSWWAYGSSTEHDPAAPPDDEAGTWFRADDLDLASDNTFYPQATTAS